MKRVRVLLRRLLHGVVGHGRQREHGIGVLAAAETAAGSGLRRVLEGWRCACGGIVIEHAGTWRGEGRGAKRAFKREIALNR